MPTSTEEEETFTYDSEAARRGWEATADLRAAVDSTRLPLLPLDRVAVLGLRIGRWLLKPEVRSQYELLSPQLFDHAILDRIEPEAWAVWYANDTLFIEDAETTGSKVSLETLQRASAIRERMLSVSTFMLADHAVAGRIVAEIRSGQGYADLAADLTRLGRLYVRYRSIVSQAGVKYDEADVEAANGASAQILLELGENEKETLKKAKKDAGRAFAVLERDYDEVRRWALPIWQDEDLVPTLYSVRGAGRTPRRGGSGGANQGGSTTGSTKPT